MSHYRKHFEEGEVLDADRLRARLAEVANVRAIVEDNPNSDEDSPEKRAAKNLSRDPKELHQEDDITKTFRLLLATEVMFGKDADYNEYPDGPNIIDILNDLTAAQEYCADEDCPESQAEDTDIDHEGEDHNEGLEHEEHGAGTSHTHTHTHTHGSFSGAAADSMSGQGEFRGSGDGIRIQIQDLRQTDSMRMRTSTRAHEGNDYGAAIGTPLGAIEDGRVVHAGQASGYGNIMILSHGDGIYSAYAHLDSFGARIGQTVAQGEVFARSGNTGIGTGPHLHLELIIRDQNGALRTVDAERAEGKDLTDPAVRSDLLRNSTQLIGGKNNFNLAGRISGPEFNA